MSNQYAKRDHRALGEHYLRHVSAMTGEGLHAKSDIAAELAWRDAEIERLRAELFFVLRGDGLEHLYDGDCPASNALHARDPQCPACKRLDELAATEAARKFCGVGELERAGYIPAGSADEREAKP